MDTVTAAGLLSKILSKLESPWDLAAANTVCRSWQQASKETFPCRLLVRPRDLYTSACTGIPRYFQQQLRTNRLDKLTAVHMVAHENDLEPITRSISTEDILLVQNLFTGVAIVLGLTNLKICHLEGLPHVPAVLELLPVSLQILKLCPSSEQVCDLSSSAFARFTNLQNLSLHDIETTRCCLFADVSMPNLRTLELSIELSTATDCAFADLFPRVHCVAADVGLNLPGLKLANELLLCVPDVTIRCVGGYPNQVCELGIPRTSVLKHLGISVVGGQDVNVQVQCPGVRVLVKGRNMSGNVTVEIL